MEAAQKLVDSTISSKPLVIFSKSYCPFCVKVKNLFQNEIKVSSDKIVVMELEDRDDCQDIQAYLKQLTGASSVPRVFIQGKSIGGCDDTFRLHESGELKRQLEAASVLQA